jgi:hypothetical protein
MGQYKHKLVSKIHQTIGEQLGEDLTGDLHHPHRYSQLKNFRIRLQKEMRGVYTKTRDNTSAWVCMDNEPMALGWVGYGDYQTSKSGDPKYVVCARDIENMKYSDYTIQHNMRMATNIDTAIKHAKGHMRKYTTDDIAKVFGKDVKRAINGIKDKARDEFREAVSGAGIKLSGHRDGMDNTLMTELFNMVHAGHKFTNGELDASIRTLMVKKKENDRFGKGVTPVNFLRTYKHYDGMRVDITRIADITGYRHEPMHEHKHTYLAQDLPDDFAGKVAVMSMCEDKHFVEGVGYRVNEAMFYFYVEDVTT